MIRRWRIQLLGGLCATLGAQAIRRFRTRKTESLLAYLAFHPLHAHPREVLIELFWPEVQPQAGRQSLSQSISSLRHQLEPPGVTTGAILEASRAEIRLNPEAFTTDAEHSRHAP